MKHFCRPCFAFSMITGILLSPLTSSAKVTFAQIFNHNGIIQCEKPAPVWGFAAPGEKVTIELSGANVSQKHHVRANADGVWVATLSPLAPGAKFKMFAKGENSTDVRTQLQAGDVWLFAGRYLFRYGTTIKSKMNDSLWKKENPDIYPYLRIFGLTDRTDTPQRLIRATAQWRNPDFYYVFFFNPGIATQFGIELVRDKKIPVGIVHAGEILGRKLDINEYIPPQDFAADPVLGKTAEAEKLKYLIPGTPEYRKLSAERIAAMEKFIKDAEAATQKNQAVGIPVLPEIPKEMQTDIGRFYHGSIHPLLPLAIKGVIYDDPSENWKTPQAREEHAQKIVLLCKSFRKMFHDPNLPILLIQPAAYGHQNTNAFTGTVNGLLLAAEENPDNHIVTLNGLSSYKLNVFDTYLKLIPQHGRRVCDVAKQTVYQDKDALAAAPVPKEFLVNGKTVTIRFSAPLATLDGGNVNGFALRAKNTTYFRPAQTKIDGDKLILEAGGVNAPEEVSYSFENQSMRDGNANLCGKNKMPLAAFKKIIPAAKENK